MGQLVASDLKDKTKNFSYKRLPNRSFKILWEEKKNFRGESLEATIAIFQKKCSNISSNLVIVSLKKDLARPVICVPC